MTGFAWKMIKAVEFYQEIRGGSSLPLIIGGSDGGKYVVKLRGAGDGILTNVVEWLAIKLGQLARLPVLEPALLVIDNEFAKQAPDPEIREVLEKSAGMNFGTKLVEGASILNEHKAFEVGASLKGEIFLYDLFLLNVDRNARNPNLIFNRNGLWALDYSSSMTIRSAIDGRNYEKLAVLREIKRHPFYSHEIEAYDFVRRLREIPDESVRDVVDGLPDEWLDHLPVGKAAGDKRKTISRRLIDEKNHAHVLMKRLDLLKVLKLETDEERSLRMNRNRERFERKFGELNR
jgi:hypothetical protein